MKNDSITKKDETRFVVRLPSPLHERLAASAKVNGRSMNSEIIAMLASNLGELDDDYRKQAQRQLDQTAVEMRAVNMQLKLLEARSRALHSDLAAFEKLQSGE
jgi:hypothetical protein